MSTRVALITGGSRGIGAAIARQFAADGLTVIINHRDSAHAAETAQREIQERGGQAIVRQFDVSSREQVDAAIAALTEELGVIDILVNNAATQREQPLLRVKQDDWDRTLGINLSGVFYCTQAVLKTWSKHRYGSRVINLTSIGGERGFRHSTVYGASKAGVIGFTKSLAEELGPKGVTVNAVSPGFILTEATAGMDQEAFAAQTPLRRIGRPEEVADLVSFLASERAGFITGQVIRINGGLYM